MHTNIHNMYSHLLCLFIINQSLYVQTVSINNSDLLQYTGKKTNRLHIYIDASNSFIQKKLNRIYEMTSTLIADRLEEFAMDE
jgi:phage pi2 protein 07